MIKEVGIGVVGYSIWLLASQSVRLVCWLLRQHFVRFVIRGYVFVPGRASSVCFPCAQSFSSTPSWIPSFAFGLLVLWGSTA